MRDLLSYKIYVAKEIMNPAQRTTFQCWSLRRPLMMVLLCPFSITGNLKGLKGKQIDCIVNLQVAGMPGSHTPDLMEGTGHPFLQGVQFSSVAQSCLTLCEPMNHSTPGLPVHHHLPESTQTHIHQVRDAIQPSHPRSSPSPPVPNPSQHQSFPMSQLFS